MSVADKPVAERAPRSPQQQLALGSLLGALYVLLGLWIIFAGVPALWAELVYHPDPEQRVLNEFLADALLVVLDLAVVLVLAFVGHLLLRRQTQPGLRAGILVASVALLISVLIGFGVGRLLRNAELGRAVGWPIMGAAIAGLAAGVFWLMSSSASRDALIDFEEQGWFTFTPYKGNQGVRIRRATVLGALVLGFSGIVTMVSHRSFGSDRVEANDWYLTLPFSVYSGNVDNIVAKIEDGKTLNDDEKALVRGLVGVEQPDAQQLQLLKNEHGGKIITQSLTLPLMYKLHVVLPIVFGVLLLWFAYRLVNVPTFADFLIATEAEMNKVSWTTRKRLFQDTIVVLVTVLLMTVFLFFIDILWIKVLGGIGVLQVDVKTQLQKQQEKSQW